MLGREGHRARPERPRQRRNCSPPWDGRNKGHENNAQHPRDLDDDDDFIIHNVRVDAPNFDGSLDPVVYLDWKNRMD